MLNYKFHERDILENVSTMKAKLVGVYTQKNNE